MAAIGRLVNGKFIQIAGNFDVMNSSVMTADSTKPGLLSVEDKKKIDASYTDEDVADEADILSEIFNK